MKIRGIGYNHYLISCSIDHFFVEKTRVIAWFQQTVLMIIDVIVVIMYLKI